MDDHAAASASSHRNGWHVGRWGPLGWTETALKLAGAAVGIAALAGAVGEDADAPSGARLAQVIVLAVLSLGLLAAIADRYADRELVGMAFIVAMNAGHLAMLTALAIHDAGGYLWAFAGLMLAGDLVKLAFLRTTGFRVRDIAPAVVYGLTLAFAGGYVALMALQAW